VKLVAALTSNNCATGSAAPPPMLTVPQTDRAAVGFQDQGIGHGDRRRKDDPGSAAGDDGVGTGQRGGAGHAETAAPIGSASQADIGLIALRAAGVHRRERDRRGGNRKPRQWVGTTNGTAQIDHAIGSGKQRQVAGSVDRPAEGDIPRGTALISAHNC